MTSKNGMRRMRSAVMAVPSLCLFSVALPADGFIKKIVKRLKGNKEQSHPKSNGVHETGHKDLSFSGTFRSEISAGIKRGDFIDVDLGNSSTLDPDAALVKRIRELLNDPEGKAYSAEEIEDGIANERYDYTDIFDHGPNHELSLEERAQKVAKSVKAERDVSRK